MGGWNRIECPGTMLYRHITHDTYPCMSVGRNGQSGTTNIEYPYGKGEYSLGKSTGPVFFFPTNVKERRGKKLGVATR